MLEISPAVAVAEGELAFAFSRSGGPGGQNVNKVATRVTLAFDLARSTSLSDAQKTRIRERLATRVSRDGMLRVVSQRHRTQAANRRAVVERFVELLRAALAEEAPRLPTHASRTAKVRRVEEKKRRGRLKVQRSRPPSPDE
jgi:ribosome-associated protein